MAQLIKVNANLLNEGLQVEIGNGTQSNDWWTSRNWWLR